jgi:glutamate dehydrogenase (NAD(P)+)
VNTSAIPHDDLGPAKVIQVYEPSVGLEGMLTVDNVATGPSIGGLRMAPDVTAEECFRLARAMTLKNAAAGLPHGGGKSVIKADPRMDSAAKQALIRAFAYALRNEQDYIFGPDMGTDERCMAWVKDEIGRSVGLPRELGGIPLDQIGATGWGMRHATEVAAASIDLPLPAARLVVQGFGAVGKHAARFLGQAGVKLIAASDSTATVLDPAGLSVDQLIVWKDSGKSLADYTGAEVLERDAVVGIECDIWAPAARPDVIDMSKVDQLKTRVVIEGANIPITEDAERALHRRAVLVVPDFVANAGGVICAALEYRGASERDVFAVIEEKIRRNTEETLDNARRDQVTPREAAVQLARGRVHRAMTLRRWSIY